MLITFITFLQVFFLFLRHFYLFFPCQFLDSTLLWLCSHSLNYNKNIFVKIKLSSDFYKNWKLYFSSQFQKYFVLLAVKCGIIKFDFNYILPLSKVSSLKSKFATSVIFLAILSAELSALSRKELCPEPITPDILFTYFDILCCYEDEVEADTGEPGMPVCSEWLPESHVTCSRSNNMLQSRCTPCAFACVILELKTIKRVLSAKQGHPCDLHS